jgi:hypothetical protein
LRMVGQSQDAVPWHADRSDSRLMVSK